ncbi:MAG: bifunctional phosphoribosyl-AMP cyclohydrolase/phosphoribosyl-ATP diphosphatase HisIE [Clostridiales bacterium]|nr:bifunctional phosphoribosyl-AMP cyclohydrolase/phosphoribosyl-ATP diphosphatase HisIE [Clostridiales bacterium]
MENILNELKFDEKGLIPAVVQDVTTKEVLMVAYMNAEALELTLKTGKATFWSRSRQEIWVKGETSGNIMHVKGIKVDCDGDCLIVLARPDGPACHTGSRSCFFRRIDGDKLAEDTGVCGTSDILMREFATITDRKNNPEDGSYTNYLFNKGEDKILKKVGEEAAEVVIAGKNRDKDEIKYETADLLYHLAVMLADNDMTWDDIFEEMERRAD